MVTIMSVTVETKGSSVIVRGIGDKPIKIPSQMYPLTGTLNILSHTNTAPFEDTPQTDKIRAVFDSITPDVGRCYTNTEKLLDALAREGIEAKSFVGWLFPEGDMPVHHCFTVIDNHILDFNPNLNLLHPKMEAYATLSMEAARDKFTDVFLEMREMPNSEAAIFGQIDMHSIYFASPCKPSDGLKIYNKLMKAYPKHPCYTNLTNGTNATQKMILKKQSHD